MVGPAGCGKSTIARNTAKELDIPYLCISCGIGTSATEFTGYKYPTREATKFAEFYAKKSTILIDEMTALDPSVAQGFWKPEQHRLSLSELGKGY